MSQLVAAHSPAAGSQLVTDSSLLLDLKPYNTRSCNSRFCEANFLPTVDSKSRPAQIPGKGRADPRKPQVEKVPAAGRRRLTSFFLWAEAEGTLETSSSATAEVAHTHQSHLGEAMFASLSPRQGETFFQHGPRVGRENERTEPLPLPIGSAQPCRATPRLTSRAAAARLKNQFFSDWFPAANRKRIIWRFLIGPL